MLKNWGFLPTAVGWSHLWNRSLCPSQAFIQLQPRPTAWLQPHERPWARLLRCHSLEGALANSTHKQLLRLKVERMEDVYAEEKKTENGRRQTSSFQLSEWLKYGNRNRLTIMLKAKNKSNGYKLQNVSSCWGNYSQNGVSGCKKQAEAR